MTEEVEMSSQLAEITQLKTNDKKKDAGFALMDQDAAVLMSKQPKCL